MSAKVKDETVATLTLAILSCLKDAPAQGLKSSTLYTQAGGSRVDMTVYTRVIDALSKAGLLVVGSQNVQISSEGKIQAERLIAANLKKETPVTTTKTKKLTKAQIKATLIKRIEQFPARFKIKGQEKVCMISPSESKVDPETGEEMLALVSGTGEVLGTYTPDNLLKVLLKLKGKKGKAEKEPKEPKAKSKKPRRMGNVKRTKAMILEGKSYAEILEHFTEHYEKHGSKAEVSPEFVARRVKRFVWRCGKNWPKEMRHLVKKLRGQHKAAIRAAKKSKGKKKAAKGA